MLDKRNTVQSKYTYHNTTRIGKSIKHSHERILFKKWFPELRPNAKILEIGTGRGEFAETAVSLGYKYIGVEPSWELREILIARGFDILSEPIPEIKLADKSVDLVHCSDVVEHLDGYKIVLNFLFEVMRVLKDGGIISVIAPNYDTLQGLFFKYEYQHAFITNESRIEGVIIDSGFSVERSLAFLTPIGFTKYNVIDRILAHSILPFARCNTIYTIGRLLFGNNIIFKLHKNLCDHIGIIARKKV